MPTSTNQPERIFLLLLVYILLLFGSVANLEAQDQPTQQPLSGGPVQTTEKLNPQQSSMLMELEKLKAQTGGGVAERLEGVVPGSDPKQQSFDLMKNLIKSQPASESAPQSQVVVPPGFSKSGTDARLRATGNAQPDAALPSGPDGGQSNSSNADPAQQLLRSSARMLEQVAADLEQAQLYDQADEIRKTAAQYWLQARSMD